MYFTILYYWNDFLLGGSMMEHYRAMCHQPSSLVLRQYRTHVSHIYYCGSAHHWFQPRGPPSGRSLLFTSEPVFRKLAQWEVDGRNLSECGGTYLKSQHSGVRGRRVTGLSVVCLSICLTHRKTETDRDRDKETKNRNLQNLKRNVQDNISLVLIP